MFDSFTWLARQAERVAATGAPGFRKLKTRRGDYFVDWSPGSVNALIESEGIAAGELLIEDPRDLHRLTRELFLLGFRDELDTGAAPSISPVSRLARELLQTKSRPERDCCET